MTIPVILDTDIGLDVDDVWALAFMLRCPELDVKLITTNTGDTVYSAALAAKLLEIGGRTDVAVGVGVAIDAVAKTHADWLGDYALDDYPGEIYRDGVGALIDVVEQSDEPVVIVCIGPAANIAEALSRAPGMVGNSRFIGMHGSIRKGYFGADKPHREYNVYTHTAACQAVFSTPWNISITPLDTCGLVSLRDENFQLVRDSEDPLVRAVLENHDTWSKAVSDWPGMDRFDLTRESSILFDTVAVYMAFSEELLDMESLPVTVTNKGMTVLEEGAQVVRCATGWKNREVFEALVADRLSGISRTV